MSNKATQQEQDFAIVMQKLSAYLKCEIQLNRGNSLTRSLSVCTVWRTRS